jgi:DMSO/TMAO reductase YedYZ molybdopterin-dependent catalytic subunit
LIFLPVVGQGIFGTKALSGPETVNITLLVTYAIYAIALGASIRVPATPEQPADVDPMRRRLLGSLAVGATAVAAAAVANRTLRSDTADTSTRADAGGDLLLGPTLITAAYPLPPPSPPWAVPGLSAEITPTPKFYVVTKNLFSDPHLDARQWSLTLTGLVARSVRLTYADLLKLPAIEFYQTLECISNSVGGDLMSTAWWRGVRLKDILALAGPNPRTVKVVFHAADEYADSIPLTAALQPDTVLVYQMNREPLPIAHGYPVRLLAPGRYGLKNVKWLVRIELVDVDFKGYWQERGWTDTARVHTMSRIDPPRVPVSLKAGRVAVGGVAFAGDRGIKRVQVSLDEGKSWEDALLKPPLGPLTWNLWRYEWDARPGTYSIFVQATDGTGRLQWQLPQDTVPDGATGQDVKILKILPP